MFPKTSALRTSKTELRTIRSFRQDAVSHWSLIKTKKTRVPMASTPEACDKRWGNGMSTDLRRGIQRANRDQSSNSACSNSACSNSWSNEEITTSVSSYLDSCANTLV